MKQLFTKLLIAQSSTSFVWNKRIQYLLGSIIILLLTASGSMAQNVSVIATGGTTSATYATLKEAFDIINSGGHTGTITLNIVGNTTETAAASLQASGTGGASYTSVLIQPSGGVIRSISGTISGNAVVDLNGADHITIDGLNTGGNGLVISNTSTASATGTSTIRLRNDASNNTIQNCSVLGSATGVVGKTITTGTILLAGGITTGNDNNTIAGNEIKDGSTMPTLGISSVGTSASVSNDNNIVSNNQISNWYSATTGANAINIANSSAWTISGNQFFQTSTRNITGQDSIHKAIYIDVVSGSGFVVNNNRIGYASSTATGMMAYTGNGKFTGIELTVAKTPMSEIQGNTINGISVESSAGNSVLGSATFNGIAVLKGGVNMGTVTGNIIGDTTGVATSTSNIYVSGSTTSIGGYPIYVQSDTNCFIVNNRIGAFSIYDSAYNGTLSFTGITTSCLNSSVNFFVRDNQIGNSTANNISITLETVSNANLIVKGIEALALTDVSPRELRGDISNNTIQNISQDAQTNYFECTGINTFGGWNYLTIKKNTISQLSAICSIMNASPAKGIVANSAVGSYAKLDSNLISTISVAGDLMGISLTAPGGFGNTVIGNRVSNLSSSGDYNSTNGIYVGIPEVAMDHNTIWGLTTSGSQMPTIKGISIVEGASLPGSGSINLNANKIYDLSATGAITNAGAVIGLSMSGSQTGYSYNTVIGNLTAPQANGDDIIRGISYTSTEATRNFAFYNSTIYINASSTGTNFGTTGVYHTASTTSTTGALLLRNTIIYNNSVPNGTGLTVAFRRSAGTTGRLSNYTSTSNYNLWYAGTPATNRLIYYDGVSSAQTFAAYKTGVFTAGTVASRDANSVTAMINWISTTGADTNFLSIVPSIATPVESGGLYAANMFNSYNDVVRVYPQQWATQYGGLAPDIGAYEFDGAKIDTSKPVVSYNIFSYHPSTTSATLTNFALITDAQSLVNTSTKIARLYYKRSQDSNVFIGNTPADHGWKWAQGTNATNLYTFTLDYSLIKGGSVARGDTIQYFVVAQDNATPPNLNSNPALGLMGSGIDAITHAPDSFNRFIVSPGWSGTYSIGGNGTGPSAGCSYASLSEAMADASTAKVIKSIYVTNGGSGYTTAPTVTINGVSQTAATATAIVTAGVVTQIKLTARGTGYVTAPTVTITGDGTGAAAVANVSGGRALDSATIFELTPTHASAQEDIFPIAIPAIGNSSSTKTLTIRPALGYSDTLIADAPIGLLNLNGAKYVTLDGRAGGVDSTNNWVIENTSTVTTAYTLMLNNDASFNTFRFLTFKGSSPGTTGGMVWVSNTTGTTGNDSNTFDFCRLTKSGNNYPANTFASYGSTTNTALYNTGNKISNCVISDFFHPIQTSNGLWITTGNVGWIVSNNHIFQPDTLLYTGGPTVTAIAVLGGNSGVIVNHNFIGGNSPTGNGKMVLAGSSGCRFFGINLLTGMDGLIDNNTITNIESTSGAITGTLFTGISVGSVTATVSNNTIGSATSYGAIAFKTLNTAGTNGLVGISLGSSTNGLNIINNIVSGIRILGTSIGAVTSFDGVLSTVSGLATVTGNTIGSAILADHIVNDSSALPIPYRFRGITVGGSTTVTYTVNNNLVANLTNRYWGTGPAPLGSTTAGIYVNIGISNVTNNVVRNLKTTTQATGTGINSGLVGIAIASNILAQGATYVTSNTIHSLELNGNTTTAVRATGLSFSSTPNIENIVNRNKIHSIYSTSSNPLTIITGIEGLVAAINYSNNIIRLGIDTNGASQTTPYSIWGIRDSIGDINYYYNTVYIGGSGVSLGSASTYAFEGRIAGRVRNFRNNIFYNARSNANMGGKHYAVKLAGVGVNPEWMVCNNNLYYAGGKGGVMAYYNGSDISNISMLRQRTGQDSNSVNRAVSFANATGSASVVDLRVINTGISNPMESGGVNIVDVYDDMDSLNIRVGYPKTAQANGGGTAPDIGAYEFDGAPAQNMVFDSLSVIQQTDAAYKDSTNQRVIAIRVSVTGSKVPLTVSSLVVKATGTTNLLDVGTVKIYYTGASPMLDMGMLFGSKTTPSAVNDTISGTQKLNEGDNYFWLTYDVFPSAATGNLLDAELISIAIDTAWQLPSVSAPAGARSIMGAMHGTYLVGLTQVFPNFSTIAAALTDVRKRGVDAAVVFSLMDLNYPTETYPIVLDTVLGASKINTVTFQPDSSVTDTIRFVTNNTQGVFDFVRGKFFVVDGRSGGVGNINRLLIENTSIASTAFAIRMINDASWNTVRYVTIKGAGGNLNGGVVFVGTTTGLYGNDSNVFSHCTITNSGTNFPFNTFCSVGNTLSSAAYNHGNVISNCSISNFYHSSGASAGILIGLGNGGWIVDSNTIYQTDTRTYTGTQTVKAIWVGPNTSNLTTDGSGFVITNNTIGGNTATGFGVWTMSGTTAYLFNGIHLSVGTTAPTSVQNNTINNISFTSGSTVTTSCIGILVSKGDVNIGNVQGNMIGSTLVNDAFQYTSSITGGGFSGINIQSNGNCTIQNNTIAGIRLRYTNFTASTSFVGLAIAFGTTMTVTDNTINNIISDSTASISTVYMMGVSVNGSPTMNLNLNNNTISNLSLNHSRVGSYQIKVAGIYLSAVNAVVRGNTICNLKTTAQVISAGANASMMGISVAFGSNSLMDISQNHIYGLTLAGVSGNNPIRATGIGFSGAGTSVNNRISGNRIHSIYVPSANPSAIVTGIEALGGTAVVYSNNIIRLGLDTLGTSDSIPYTIIGIRDSIGTNSFYFNTVYIGGSSVGTNLNHTYAFSSARTTGTRDFRNNIFYNTRSTATTGAKHYAIKVAGTGTAPAGLTIGYNSYYASGNGGVFGYYNNLDVTGLFQWSKQIVQDSTSVNRSIDFVNATGSDVLLDLHIQPGLSALESRGIAIAGDTGDIDGSSTRNSYPLIGQLNGGGTAPDIGADEFDGMPLTDTLAYVSSTAVQQTGYVYNDTINQQILRINIGMEGIVSVPKTIQFTLNARGTTDTTDLLKAKLYYTGDVPVFDTMSLFGSSTIPSLSNYIIAGTQSLMGGNNYFWLVYDMSYTAITGNVVDAECVNITIDTVLHLPTDSAPAGNKSVIGRISGTFTVGVSQPADYNTLTAAANSVTRRGVYGPVLLNLIDTLYATSEIFPIVIGNVKGSSSVNTLTIRPDSAQTLPVSVSGSLSTGILSLNSGKYVTIDGRAGGLGSTHLLTIVNKSTAASAYTVEFLNDASNNKIQYCDILGAGSSVATATIMFRGTTGLNGNDNDSISYCNIGNATTGVPTAGLYSFGSTTTALSGNDYGVIHGCNIYNFYNTITGGRGVYLSSGNNGWKITGNSFYQTADRTTIGQPAVVSFINIGNGDASAINNTEGFVIQNNYLGGKAPNATGGYCKYTTVQNSQLRALNIATSNTATVNEIQGNVFSNIWFGPNTGPTTKSSLLRVASGLANIGTTEANHFGDSTVTNSIVFNPTGSSGTFSVIELGAMTTLGAVNVSNNRIAGVSITGGSTELKVINIMEASNGTCVAEYNTIGNNGVNNSISNGTLGSTYGIYGAINSSNTRQYINHNTIVNLTSGTSGVLVGIYVPPFSSPSNIIGNTIGNLNTRTSTGWLRGITQSTISVMDTIADNTIYNLFVKPAVANANIYVYGIYAEGTDVLYNNSVRSMNVTSSANNNVLQGITASSGSKLFNNTVVLGDSAGYLITRSHIIYGLLTSGQTKVFYNTVRLMGTGIPNLGASYAFYSSNGQDCEVKNNILSNERVLGGDKYAAWYFNPNNLNSDYNVYHSTGAPVFGYYTLYDWQLATARDWNSYQANPIFQNMDSLIPKSCAPNNHASPISAISFDASGNTRHATNPDIGAYEFASTQAGIWTGDLDSMWNHVENWSCPVLPDSTTNVLILPTRQERWATITDVQQAANVTILPSAAIRLRDTISVFSIYGSFDNQGLFSHANGKLILTGSSQQTLPSGNYVKVEINNNANVNLGGNVTLTDSIILTKGKVLLDAYNLVLDSTSFASQGSDNSYVSTNGTGKMIINKIGNGSKTGMVMIPVGNSSYNPVQMSNTGTADQFMVSVIDSITDTYAGNTPTGAAITHDVVNRTWLINEAVAGGSNAAVSVGWKAVDELPGFVRSSSYVAHYTGTAWDNFATSAASGSALFMQTRSALTSFGPFGIGSNGVLPVSGLYFTGIKQNSNIRLSWSTATETNNNYFELQRSVDGKIFKPVAKVKGHGTTLVQHDYTYLDNIKEVQSPIVYYRLAQVDLNGAVTMSDIVAINLDGNHNMMTMGVSPNPFVTDAILHINTPVAEQVTIMAADIQGRVVWIKQAYLNAGENEMMINELTQEGMYFITLTSGTESRVVKVVKTK